MITPTSPPRRRDATPTAAGPRLVATQAWAARGHRGPDRRASLPGQLEMVSRVWRLRTDSWTPRRRGAHLKAVEADRQLKPSDSTDGIPSSPGDLRQAPRRGPSPIGRMPAVSFGPSRPDSRLSAHVRIMPITREILACSPRGPARRLRLWRTARTPVNSGEGDLESGLTDGRHDSKAIEHLAAAAAAHAARVGDVGRWPS